MWSFSFGRAKTAAEDAQKLAYIRKQEQLLERYQRVASLLEQRIGRISRELADLHTQARVFVETEHRDIEGILHRVELGMEDSSALLKRWKALSRSTAKHEVDQVTYECLRSELVGRGLLTMDAYDTQNVTQAQNEPEQVQLHQHFLRDVQHVEEAWKQAHQMDDAGKLQAARDLKRAHGALRLADRLGGGGRDPRHRIAIFLETSHQTSE